MSETAAGRPPVAVEWIKRRRRLPWVSRWEMQCLLRRGQLRFRYGRVWKIRHHQVGGQIVDAIRLLGYSDLPRFSVNLTDRPLGSYKRSLEAMFRSRSTMFSACTVAGSREIAAPDFSFGGWPEAEFEDFDAKVKGIADASRTPPRDDRAFWAGKAFNSARKALARAATTYPDLLSVLDTTPNFDQGAQLYIGGLLPMEEQAATYRYLVDVEGAGYSARLKLLLHAGRVVLLQSYPWREYFFDEIEPWRHFVPVAADFSDIAERIDWLRANPRREAEIIAEAQDFARRVLTRKGAVEAWARLLEKHKAAGGRLRGN